MNFSVGMRKSLYKLLQRIFYFIVSSERNNQSPYLAFRSISKKFPNLKQLIFFKPKRPTSYSYTHYFYRVYQLSGYKLSGQGEYTLTMGNHIAMYGRKCFPRAVVTTQNARKTGH